jgi:hypothetical protein
MRDNLALAHIQTELWKAYVITRQGTVVVASAQTQGRRVLRSLPFLKGLRRLRQPRSGA